MKTKLYDSRFGTYISKSGTSPKKNFQDDEFDEVEVPWICCNCGKGNDADDDICFDCGHDRCARCKEI